MIAAGVNAKALSSFMGHASVTITLDRYGHLFSGSEEEAAELLNAYLGRAETNARLAQVTSDQMDAAATGQNATLQPDDNIVSSGG